MDLQLQIERVKDISRLVENEEGYQQKLTEYFPDLTKTIEYILNCAHNTEFFFDINEQLVLQVLNDIMYGMKHQDSVFLLDVLRYGLLEIYQYGKDNLQSEDAE